MKSVALNGKPLEPRYWTERLKEKTVHGSPSTVRAASEILCEVVEATIKAVEGGSALRKSQQSSSEKSTMLVIDDATAEKGDSDRDVFAETSGAETDSGAVEKEGQTRADPEEEDEGFFMAPGQARASQEKGGESATSETEQRAPHAFEQAEANRDVDDAPRNEQDDPEEDPLGSLGSGFPEEE